MTIRNESLGESVTSPREQEESSVRERELRGRLVEQERRITTLEVQVPTCPFIIKSHSYEFDASSLRSS